MDEKPSISETSNSLLRVLPAAPRYLRRNAERAMGGHAVRGLVELISNARDSGYRLLHSGVIDPPSLAIHPIEVEYRSSGGEKQLLVRDHFEGMSRQIMESRLLQYGAVASGFESGAHVRGMNARGAKDVGVLGRVRFESIHEGNYVTCEIMNAMYSPPEDRPATSTDRTSLGLMSGNGTVVRLFPAPNVAVPGFEALARDLEHHIEIRYQPEASPRIPIVLREIKSSGRVGKERDLIGFRPQGTLLSETEIAVPGYEAFGGATVLTLSASTEPLQLGGNSVARLWKAEAGIVVTDGRTAHDVTLFGARGLDNSGARHLFGELFVPQIPALLIAFEAFERHRETNPMLVPDPANPSQVTDPDRQGLNFQHPFVTALEGQVRPHIEKALALLEKRFAPPAQDRLSAELREALRKVGARLAPALEVSTGISARGSHLPDGLSIVPPVVRLEPGQTRRVGIYLRGTALPQSLQVLGIAVSESDSVYLPHGEFPLESVINKPGTFRGSIEIRGDRLAELVWVRVSVAGQQAALRVSVREPLTGTISLEKDLQFSQRRYTSVPARRKRIEVFADPSLSDQVVNVSVHGGVTLSEKEGRLAFDDDRGVAVAQFLASSETSAHAVLEVSLDGLSDVTEVLFEAISSAPEIEFTFTDRTEFVVPGRRFQWDSQRPGNLLIAAKHPTLQRVLGPDVDPRSGHQWPGQHSPQARAVLAELISEAYVARRLDREIASGALTYGPENLVDPVEYESFRYKCFEECFMICHEILTPAYAES